MSNTQTLTLCGQTAVVLPNTLNLMTPYVLTEQGDWFEDEIKFVRRLLAPGMQVIDIGANYGVYTLSMAACVGDSGKVWAFEPSRSTAAFLSKSIEINQFQHVILDKRAISDSIGIAHLSVNENSELNALVSSAGPNTESVEITTLDRLKSDHAWDRIDFLKIDAEGEEEKIIAGGAEFFSSLSPIVQYEIKAGEAIHFELIDTFHKLGYQSYRLVPGLHMLIPFDRNTPTDGYLLNLFCCKPEVASQLSRRGLLVMKQENIELDSHLAKSRYSWRNALAPYPYANALFSEWDTHPIAPSIEKAIALHAISLDAEAPLTIRLEALRMSVEMFFAISQQPENRSQLLSLARTAHEYGMRSLAVDALSRYFQNIMETGEIAHSAPFLSPLQRFDSLSTDGRIEEWMLAGAMEALERLSTFSSFFSGTESLQRLEAISGFGFASAEMQRRLNLVQRRVLPN